MLYMAFGSLMSGLVVFTSLEVAGSTGDAIADFLLLAVFLGGVLAAVTCPFWLWTAGRTSYSVRAGRFYVLAGRKLIGSWELSEMRAVRFESAPDWVDLLTPLNIGGGMFPRVTFFNDAGRVEARPIMLWDRDTTISAERALIAAIASNRSR